MTENDKLPLEGFKEYFINSFEKYGKIEGDKIIIDSGLQKQVVGKIYNKDKEEKKKLKEEYLSLVRDKEIAKASEILVEYIKRKHYIYTTKDDKNNETWIYRDGIYVPQGKSEIKILLREVLEEWFSAFVFNLVMNKIEADTSIDQDAFFKNENAYEIPVQNGILNINTRELTPFNPKKIFFNKLSVKYNPDAKCTQIEKFLKDILSKEEDVKVFYELGGFCLLKEYRFEKAFMFVGNGRNGKDKSLELIKRLIGIENCCSVPINSIIPNTFIISEFYSKMVNLSGEINNQDLKDTSMFKALTGRSLISAPRKFLNPITFVNYAKFIFACNELPMVYDNSRGFWDRWILLEFPYTFVSEQELSIAKDTAFLKLRDESIIDKITTQEEMEGMLIEFLNGLNRLNENKGFSYTEGTEDIKKLWVRKSNSVMAFILDNIEEQYDGHISKKDFRRKYVEYCKKHKINAKSDFVIKKTLEETFGVTEGNREEMNVWNKVWEGIKWKI